MSKKIDSARRWVGFLIALYFLGMAGTALAEEPVELSTGKVITPTAATGSIFQDLYKPDTNPNERPVPANQAIALAVSPDGKLLAILTSGWNFAFSNVSSGDYTQPGSEFVYLFDVTGPKPVQVQVLKLPNTWQGLAWGSTSDELFVSGGSDDCVVAFEKSNGRFVASHTYELGHTSGLGIDTTFGATTLKVRPMAGALALSPDGTRLLVANFENDSVSLIDLKNGKVAAEQDLRPGKVDPRFRGQPGGSYPRSVVWVSPARAYVASERDREIVALRASGSVLTVVNRIPVHGQPIALIANRSGSRIYTALDNTDRVAIIDTVRSQVMEQIPVVAPISIFENKRELAGANPNALALTPDEKTLLVSNGGENAIAVVKLGSAASPDVVNSPDFKGERGGNDDEEEDHKIDHSTVIGLVPTGYYPTSVAISKDGGRWYAINAKSETGANAGWCKKVDASGACVSPIDVGNNTRFGALMLSQLNQFGGQLQRAGFLSLPAPSGLDLARLTKQVAHNNHFDDPKISKHDEMLFGFLRAHIRHVIFIIKENRTYDQILGDLSPGNGDSRLTIFPEPISPNQHAIARQFVTLDNFLLSGEGSWTGWDYWTSARNNDFRIHGEPLSAHQGMLGDEWGANRGINMGLPTSADRHAERAFSPIDPDILPGARDVAELDGPGGSEGKGYIWDAALRAGLTVRNYGFFGLLDWRNPLERDPASRKVRVFHPTKPSLMPFTDIYYRGWDTRFPDYWRFKEWKREFDGFSAARKAPSLMLMELGNDHTGSFDLAIDGVNTPETQMADNDYALGSIIEAVSASPFANDTLIVAVEDDTCDGPDHVDAMRSMALVAGPYVRQRALVSTRYTTVNLVRTIEEVLGMSPIGLNDALAAPMSAIFDPSQSAWLYKAVVPDVLRTTKLPLPPTHNASVVIPKHSARYWARTMAGQNFSGPDRVDPASFNRALWRGLKGNKPHAIGKKGG